MLIFPKRFKIALAVIVAINLIGTIGFKIIGGSKTSFLDALYMTAITLSTVGYGDVIGLDDKPFGKLFAIFFIFLGAGTMAYLFTSLAAYIIGGELRRIFRRRAMEKRVVKMRDHYIVCGIGMVGLYVVHDLFLTGRQQIAVDTDERKIDLLRYQNLKVDLVVGDATENETLWNKAKIEHAKGLFATTNSDNDNIVISLTARQLNPAMRIVARCNDTKNIDKLKRAGADAVVAPNYIGGLRMASEMVKPHMTSFIDMVLREKESPLRAEEVLVPKSSPFIGKPTGAIDFKAIGTILLIAARRANGEWVYNPYPETILEAGMSLLILAAPEERDLLDAIVSAGTDGNP
jgi:voltage-gated potassium channel